MSDTDRASAQRDHLRSSLVDFFHRELDRRYRRDYLEQIPAVREEELTSSLDDEKLERIKEFFKRVMYPAGEHRDHRDRAMEAVKSAFARVSSIVSLLPRVPGLLLRHGPRLPRVSAAAMDLITAYDLANHFERQSLAELERLCAAEGITDPGDIPEELFRRAYAVLDAEDVDRMVTQVNRIVGLGLKRELVRTTRDVVETVQETRPSEEERRALDYIIAILDEVHHLAGSFSSTESQTALRLAEVTEAFYFDELRRNRPGGG
jgi:hypothetical protein